MLMYKPMRIVLTMCFCWGFLLFCHFYFLCGKIRRKNVGLLPGFALINKKFTLLSTASSQVKPLFRLPTTRKLNFMPCEQHLIGRFSIYDYFNFEVVNCKQCRKNYRVHKCLRTMRHFNPSTQRKISAGNPSLYVDINLNSRFLRAWQSTYKTNLIHK